MGLVVPQSKWQRLWVHLRYIRQVARLIKGFGVDIVIRYMEKSLIIIYNTIGGLEHYKVIFASMKPTTTYATLVGHGGTNSREESDDGRLRYNWWVGTLRNRFGIHEADGNISM